jgi:hypothetical protein
MNTVVEDARRKRWAHYSTDALDRLRIQVEAENGDALPGLLGDIRDELARRLRDSSGAHGSAADDPSR